MIPHTEPGSKPGAVPKKGEAWTVFLHERERLLSEWDKLTKPVFLLTGDLHNSFAIRITDNVWEFASGPHESNNHHIGSEGHRPLNGPFQYGPRQCEILWSTYLLPDTPRAFRRTPSFCVVQVNNVTNNPVEEGVDRWIAFPRPQVVCTMTTQRNWLNNDFCVKWREKITFYTREKKNLRLIFFFSSLKLSSSHASRILLFQASIRSSFRGGRHLLLLQQLKGCARPSHSSSALTLSACLLYQPIWF